MHERARRVRKRIWGYRTLACVHGRKAQAWCEACSGPQWFRLRGGAVVNWSQTFCCMVCDQKSGKTLGLSHSLVTICKRSLMWVTSYSLSVCAPDMLFLVLSLAASNQFCALPHQATVWAELLAELSVSIPDSVAISSTDSTCWMLRMITNLPLTLPMPLMKSARILAPKAGGGSIS